MNIQELLKQERELRDAILVNSKKQQELNVKTHEDNTGIKIGDKVQYTEDGKVVEAILSMYKFYDNRIGGIYVKPLKKDGTPGAIQRRLLSSEIETLVKID